MNPLLLQSNQEYSQLSLQQRVSRSLSPLSASSQAQIPQASPTAQSLIPKSPIRIEKVPAISRQKERITERNKLKNKKNRNCTSSIADDNSNSLTPPSQQPKLQNPPVIQSSTSPISSVPLQLSASVTNTPQDLKGSSTNCLNMKKLVSANSDYFHHMLRKCACFEYEYGMCKCDHASVKWTFQGGFGTVYSKNFNRQKPQYNQSLIVSQEYQSSLNCSHRQNTKEELTSSYMREYKPWERQQKNIETAKAKGSVQSNQHFSSLTQYNINFKDWQGGDHDRSSTKPKEKHVFDLPLQGQSTYHKMFTEPNSEMRKITQEDPQKIVKEYREKQRVSPLLKGYNAPSTTEYEENYLKTVGDDDDDDRQIQQKCSPCNQSSIANDQRNYRRNNNNNNSCSSSVDTVRSSSNRMLYKTTFQRDFRNRVIESGYQEHSMNNSAKKPRKLLLPLSLIEENNKDLLTAVEDMLMTINMPERKIKGYQS